MSEQRHDLRVYRRIGPFDAETLPKGLLGEHRLKAGSWGRLTVLSGSVIFQWDDGTKERHIRTQSDAITMPPEAPHHLELRGPVKLAIEFLRET